MLNFKIKLYFFSMDLFVLANSGDPDEMPHNATFHVHVGLSLFDEVLK